LAVVAANGVEARPGQRDAVRGEVDRELRLVMKTPNEVREPRERPGLATAKGNFEDAGLGQFGEDMEGVIEAPSTVGFEIARAERAGEIAVVRDAELHDPWRVLTEASGLRAIAQHVRA